MERINVNVGTRAEILAELTKYGKDRARQGNTAKVQAFARAVNALEEGADVVRIGSAVWHVVEDGTSASDWEIASAARGVGVFVAG